MTIRLCFIAVLSVLGSVAQAEEYLVKFNSGDWSVRESFVVENGGTLEVVSEEGFLYKWTTTQARASVANRGSIAFMEPNATIDLLPNPALEQARREVDPAEADRELRKQSFGAWGDNPAITQGKAHKSGGDPLLSNAWGIFTVGADAAWQRLPQGKDIVVAVTDTGVDYNHPDLVDSMWRNPGEIAGNGIDDDGNGFVDDVVGWDFASNDNKPFDLSVGKWKLFFFGGNPGHGTHVAGVIGAQLNNALGAAGVAPQAKIMALRFLTQSGSGKLENAVRCIDYAVANGANIINASWGGPSGSQADKALRDAILRAEAKGVLFVAAAGNGRNGAGFDNDTDAKPPAPASFDYPNMIAVAAIDKAGSLAKFSNFGAKSVKVGAPGVGVLSTVPGGKYEDTVLKFLWKQVAWNGTSMASPFVSGALAAIWSADPKQDYKTVREKLLQGAVSVPALAGKLATGGRIDLKSIP